MRSVEIRHEYKRSLAKMEMEKFVILFYLEFLLMPRKKGILSPLELFFFFFTSVKTKHFGFVVEVFSSFFG